MTGINVSDLRISPTAENDLIEIWLYIAEDQPVNADRFLDRLYSAMQKLAENPEIGVMRSYLFPDLRCFPVSHYVIYYRTQISALEIVRVLSASRDIDAIDW
jgi:toxin ParE1/3/4